MSTNDHGIPAGDGELVARLVTNHGTMVVRLEEERAPNTVANFVGLATGSKSYDDPRGHDEGTPYYDGTIFHRVIQGFMLQGGDPTGTAEVQGLHSRMRSPRLTSRRAGCFEYGESWAKYQRLAVFRVSGTLSSSRRASCRLRSCY